MRLSLLALSLLLAAAAVPTTAGAARAPADDTLYHRFWVTFSGEQQTTWAQPKHSGPNDCYRRQFHEASGEETWRLTSRAPTRVLAIVSPPMIEFRIGTWSPLAIAATPHLRLRNSDVRRRRELYWTEPGDCGGGHTRRSVGDDCGTRSTGLVTLFDVRMDGKFRWALGRDPRSAPSYFHNCSMLFPEEIADGDFESPAVPGQVAAFASTAQRTVTISWSGSFRATAPPTARPMETRTEVAWRFLFRRVGRPLRVEQLTPPRPRRGR